MSTPEPGMTDTPTSATRNVDLIIVGAGPAGVSAAIEARWHGLSVLLLDENAAPGGRIWQALEARGAKDADDAHALQILQAFRICEADAHWGATVWAIDPDGTVYWSEDGATRSARGAFVLLATGTTERPLPVPGWTLPGVMTVGAAQIALKTAGLVPWKTTWMAGQGPLLLLYAVQALRAGGRFAGVLDLSDRRARWAASKHLPHAARAVTDLRKGLLWSREIIRAGVQWIRAADLRAEGDGALSRIRFRAAGREQTHPADTLLLHDGVIPSVQITRALGLAHEWDAAQRCWKPVTDVWGVTSLPNLLVAGDGAGVGGGSPPRSPADWPHSERPAHWGASTPRHATPQPRRSGPRVPAISRCGRCWTRSTPRARRGSTTPRWSAAARRSPPNRSAPPQKSARSASTSSRRSPAAAWALPGPHVRHHRRRGDGRSPRRAGRADRTLSHPLPHQAAHARRTGSASPGRLTNHNPAGRSPCKPHRSAFVPISANRCMA